MRSDETSSAKSFRISAAYKKIRFVLTDGRFRTKLIESLAQLERDGLGVTGLDIGALHHVDEFPVAQNPDRG
jgi:hypothetical protein